MVVVVVVVVVVLLLLFLLLLQVMECLEEQLCVKVIIPRAPAASLPATPPATASSSATLVVSDEERPSSSDSLRILLAEDNPVNQRLVLSYLQRLGYSASTATNGREVLDALQHMDYEVVLMDVQMPEMDGIEATRRIRQDLQPERQPYIIAQTASGDKQICDDVGMNAFVQKPLRIEALQGALQVASQAVGGQGSLPRGTPNSVLPNQPLASVGLSSDEGDLEAV